jgi:hypothetical protein
MFSTHFIRFSGRNEGHIESNFWLLWRSREIWDRTAHTTRIRAVSYLRRRPCQQHASGMVSTSSTEFICTFTCIPLQVDGYILFSFELMHMQHSPESIFEQTSVQLTNGVCPTPILILISVSVGRNMIIN